MKKPNLRLLVPGSAEHVIAHGNWRRNRGKKNYSMHFDGILNPKKAYAAAQEFLRTGKGREMMKYETIDGITHIYVGREFEERKVLRAIVMASFELSRPAGLGFLHFQKGTQLSETDADRFISLPPERYNNTVIDMDYVEGRQCKTHVRKIAAGHFTLSNGSYERDRGKPEPMLERAKELITGKPSEGNPISASCMFSGESLTMRLREYGFERNTKESDWEFRKRIFPDFFQRDSERAFEFLLGANPADWDEMDAMLVLVFLADGRTGRNDLAKFARGFGGDPMESRNRKIVVAR